MALDWVQDIGQDPVMQKFLQLMKSDPQAAAKIDARAQELVEGELSDSMYVDYSKRTNALDGRREFPMQTALKMAMEEFAQSGQGSTPLAGVPSFAPGQDPRDAQAGLAGDGNSTLPSFAPGQGVQTGTGQFGGVAPVLDQLAGREAEDDLRGVTLSPLDQPKKSPFEAALTLDGGQRGIPGNAGEVAIRPQSKPEGYLSQVLGQNPEVTKLFEMADKIDAQGLEKGVIEERPAVTKFNQMADEIDAKGGEQTEMIRGQLLPKEDRVGPGVKPQFNGTPITESSPESGGFDLSKLLGALGSNTGLTAMGIGAQGLGGVLQGRAQNKANKAASKQQRTNNAIAAFTGGNAQQAQAKSTSSTGGNILSALGQTLGGVAQGRRGEESIAQAQANADRQFGLDERELGQVDARTATLTEVERIRAAAKVAAAGGGADFSPTEIDEMGVSARVITETLGDMFKAFTDGEPWETGMFAQGGNLGGAAGARMESLCNLLIGEINTIANLGRLSDKDLEIIESTLPAISGEGETVFLSKAKATIDQLNRRLRHNGAPEVPMPSNMGGASSGGGSPRADVIRRAKEATARGDDEGAAAIMDELEG